MGGSSVGTPLLVVLVCPQGVLGLWRAPARPMDGDWCCDASWRGAEDMRRLLASIYGPIIGQSSVCEHALRAERWPETHEQAALPPYVAALCLMFHACLAVSLFSPALPSAVSGLPSHPRPSPDASPRHPCLHFPSPDFPRLIFLVRASEFLASRWVRGQAPPAGRVAHAVLLRT